MRLSELHIKGNAKLLCDSEFDVFGILSTNFDDKKVFSYIGDERYIDELLGNKAISCIVCNEQIRVRLPDSVKGIIIAENPGEVFWRLHDTQKRQDKVTTIGKNCRINERAYVAEKNVSIGNNVVIEEFVSIKEGTVIGDNCVIRAGSMIGGMGLQLQLESSGRYRCVEHFGGVIIEDDVEIEQNVCVDRAIFAWDNTIIGNSTKIGGLCQISHAVKIGQNCCITGGVVIAGSVKIGDGVWIGINSSINNSIQIGNNAWVSMGGIVSRDIKENGKVIGNLTVSQKRFQKDMQESTGQEDKVNAK